MRYSISAGWLFHATWQASATSIQYRALGGVNYVGLALCSSPGRWRSCCVGSIVARAFPMSRSTTVKNTGTGTSWVPFIHARKSVGGKWSLSASASTPPTISAARASARAYVSCCPTVLPLGGFLGRSGQMDFRPVRRERSSFRRPPPGLLRPHFTALANNTSVRFRTHG